LSVTFAELCTASCASESVASVTRLRQHFSQSGLSSTAALLPALRMGVVESV
jgi:hypothetical protein